MSRPKRTWPLPLFRIVLGVAMFVAIIVGVREGLTLLIPASTCAGTPVTPVALSLSILAWSGVGLYGRGPGFRPLLRLGVVTLVGTFAAVLIARLVSGCTAVSGWADPARPLVEMVAIFTILVPLANLHRQFIEPRWSRAIDERMGEKREDQP